MSPSAVKRVKTGSGQTYDLPHWTAVTGLYFPPKTNDVKFPDHDHSAYPESRGSLCCLALCRTIPDCLRRNTID